MRLKVRVTKRLDEAEDIVGFELMALDGSDLPAFEAGAHIDVQTPGGPLRQYSLCNRPGERHRYQIGVLRDSASRGGSAAMHARLHIGDTVQISLPRNHFPLVEGASHSLLLAGGIGITPILAMAERLHELGRNFSLHYVTRSRSRTAYFERITASGFADRVQFHHDDGSDGQRLNLLDLLKGPEPGTQLYVCGPKGLLEATRAQAADAGWPESSVHYEYFAGAEAHSATDRHFDVVIKSSGAVIRVEASQTVVQALAEQGVIVPTSCEQGVCGTCLTSVLEGEIDHKDLYLTPEEQAANDRFLPCCSRAKSVTLVLDL